MTKKELIAKIQAKTPVSKADTAAVLEALVEVVTEALENGGQVNLAKFGTFVAVGCVWDAIRGQAKRWKFRHP